MPTKNIKQSKIDAKWPRQKLVFKRLRRKLSTRLIINNKVITKTENLRFDFPHEHKYNYMEGPGSATIK